MHFALDAAALPLVPLLIAQGRRVQRDTPRLPAAAGPSRGEIEGRGTPIRILTIGESTVAGVGAAHHEEALTGQFARALHGKQGRRVEWQAFGLSGATVAQATRSFANHLPQPAMDLIVLAFGVNDAIARTSPRRYADDLKALVGAARSRVGGDVPVFLCAAPPMQLFPALPRPLRHYLGARAALLNRTVRKTQLANITHVEFKVKAERHLFASDGFHPSVAGYAAWGEELAQIADRTLFSQALA